MNKIVALFSVALVLVLGAAAVQHWPRITAAFASTPEPECGTVKDLLAQLRGGEKTVNDYARSRGADAASFVAQVEYSCADAFRIAVFLNKGETEIRIVLPEHIEQTKLQAQPPTSFTWPSGGRGPWSDPPISNPGTTSETAGMFLSCDPQRPPRAGVCVSVVKQQSEHETPNRKLHLYGPYVSGPSKRVPCPHCGTSEHAEPYRPWPF